MKFIVRRNQTSAILGVFVVIVALLGVPLVIKTFILVMLGLSIAGIGFLTHRSLENLFTAFYDAHEEQVSATPAQTTGSVNTTNTQ
jgi:hypothetical protein